ncbi:MAG: LysR family transcriptional regulator [Spirochaetaceae bacterium]|jgi:DNA-binding transcriptional LysR family regulator|nr:LysR family transcriptional regulator [Spirochaetaceae bacterium]
MTIQQIRQFVAVARTGSILKASGELYISHQALGRSLHGFEEELGAPLLEKTLGGMGLTKLGQKILPIAEAMQKSYDDYVNLILALINMDLETFGISLEHKLLSQIIPADLTTLPGVLSVKLDIAGGRKECIAAIAGGRADLGIVYRGGDIAGLEYIPIVSGPPVVLMSRDHLLARKASLRTPDLRWAAQIWPPSLNNDTASAYLAACIVEGFYPYIALETQDFDLITRSILTRNLVHIAPSIVVQESLPRGIVTRPLIHEALQLEAGFLVNPASKKKPLIRSYIKAVVSYHG